MIPIRCFTCAKVLSNKYRTYQELVTKYEKDGERDVIMDIKYLTGNGKKIESPESKALADIEITRYCCRKEFLCSLDFSTQ